MQALILDELHRCASTITSGITQHRDRSWIFETLFDEMTLAVAFKLRTAIPGDYFVASATTEFNRRYATPGDGVFVPGLERALTYLTQQALALPL